MAIVTRNTTSSSGLLPVTNNGAPLSHAQVDGNFIALNDALASLSPNTISQNDSSVSVNDTGLPAAATISLKLNNTERASLTDTTFQLNGPELYITGHPAELDFFGDNTAGWIGTWTSYPLFLYTAGSNGPWLALNTLGALGIGDGVSTANIAYGNAGQFLQSNGGGGPPSWVTLSANSISQGDSSVVVTDSGSNGTITFKADNATIATINSSGFSATSKSFLINHPTKPGKKLRYGSLEGPEHGVYVRGKLKECNIIELPDYWTALVDPDSITVNLTPIGKHQKLYVQEVRDNKVFIANDGLFAGEINCFYIVYAERVDVDKIIVES